MNPAPTTEATEEGIKIVEDLLRSWSAARDGQDGEDITMTDDTSAEAELEELRNCVEKFRPRIEANPWLAEVLASL